MLEKLNKIPLKVPTLPLSNFQIHTTHTNICVHKYTQTYILGIVVRLLTNKLLKLRRMCMATSQLQTKIIFFLLKRQTDLKTKEVSTDITPFDSGQLDKVSTGVGGRRKGSGGSCCFIYSAACICL